MANPKKIVERKIIKTCTYTVVRNVYDNDTADIHRTCEGFNTWELLGILEDTQLDIMAQIKGLSPKPTIIKKRVIE